MRQRSKYFHQRSVAAKGENRVVFVGVIFGERGGVTWRLRLHHFTIDSSIFKRFESLATDTVSAPRRGIHDHQDPLDFSRREFHRRRCAHDALGQW